MRKTSYAIRCGLLRPCTFAGQPVNLPEETRETMVREIMDEIYGFGPLESLLADSTVSDILASGPDSVRVERNGLLEGTHVRFADEAHLLRLIHRLVEQAARRFRRRPLPMVDAKLADGWRLTAIIPPLASRGPHSPFGEVCRTPCGSRNWCGGRPSRKKWSTFSLPPCGAGSTF